MKFDYLMSIESSEGLLEEIGAQALATAAYQLPDAVLQAIDAVTHDDVVKVSASATGRTPLTTCTLPARGRITDGRMERIAGEHSGALGG